MTGISSASTAAGQSTIEPTSFSPTWPAASVPSMMTASQPMACALSACLTIVHLWMTVMPAALKAGMKASGARPEVSMMRTPSSAQTRT